MGRLRSGEAANAFMLAGDWIAAIRSVSVSLLFVASAYRKITARLAMVYDEIIEPLRDKQAGFRRVYISIAQDILIQCKIINMMAKPPRFKIREGQPFLANPHADVGLIIEVEFFGIAPRKHIFPASICLALHIAPIDCCTNNAIAIIIPNTENQLLG